MIFDTSTANCGPHSNSRVSYSLRDQSISHLYVTLLYFQPPPPLFFYINLLDPLPYHPSTLHLGINSSPRKSSYSDTSTWSNYTAYHQHQRRDDANILIPPSCSFRISKNIPTDPTYTSQTPFPTIWSSILIVDGGIIIRFTEFDKD